MAIKYTGDGLGLIISCDYVPEHDWMAFLCWYSISKNLPDAKVHVGCNRKVMQCDILRWVRRCGLPFYLHRDMPAGEERAAVKGKEALNGHLLTVHPRYVCLRDFDEAQVDADEVVVGDGCLEDIPCLHSPSRDQNPTVFVDCSDGWGKFVPSAWINKSGIPLITGVDFSAPGMGVNEARLAKLWGPASELYQNISRG